MTLGYFAYGSNLLPARLLARCPQAHAVGAAVLPGHALRFHKRSADGSAKCDAVPAAGEAVHGVLWAMAARDVPALDRSEPGYDRVAVSVRVADHEQAAFTYRAQTGRIDPGLRPYRWYRDLVVAGARAHGLPADWVAALERVETSEDPDPSRETAARALLGGEP